ncbi:MAG: UDP-N-acetylmuramoyl-L-alanine--D-glutamate ligase [Gallionella sp.]|nr:UDP-N-acetylmuramoyl-L-alanine--D-glutamate ligase [Gallionella sp.]
MTQLKDKFVLVLGLGETGLSMVRWLSAQGARLRVADSRSSPPNLPEVGQHVAGDQIFCGAFSDALFDDIELIAISPGVPLGDEFVARAMARGIPVVGDIELFAQQVRGQHLSTNPPLSPTLSREGRGGERERQPLILAITGSNGKTTVTSMVEHLCKAAYRNVVAAGNISPAVLDMVLARGENQPEIWALELSSFQLETTETLNADVATVLNVSEDHLDRYAGIDEYAAAKARIFQGCGERLRHVTAKQPIAGAAALHPLPHQTLARTVSGVQILNRDDPRSMGMARAGSVIITFGLSLPESANDFGIERAENEIWLMQGRQRLLKTGELQVAGLHNIANALAALALCSAINLPMPVLLDALRSFRGLPHRVERVAEIDGVVYYDDSKGTNVGATVAALEGLGRKVVLIAGGEGKGQDFAPLKSAVMQHARAVVLIGRDAPLIEAALKNCGVPLLRAENMNDAVLQAAHSARSGDAVLLSPACASFDMFRNYEHRAEIFVEAVHELIKEAAWSR